MKKIHHCTFFVLIVLSLAYSHDIARQSKSVRLDGFESIKTGWLGIDAVSPYTIIAAIIAGGSAYVLATSCWQKQAIIAKASRQRENSGEK